MEHTIVEAESFDICLEYIEEMIHKQEPLLNVLRLLILFSVTNSGLPKRNFDYLRRELLHSYGFEHMATLSNLEKAGLLRKQESKSNWLIIKNDLQLIVEDTDTAKVSVTFQQISAFLLSEPICSVYDLHGIHFLQNSTSSTSSGVCRIMGSRCLVPMFALNYSAVPSVFMVLHTSLLLRYATLPNANSVEVNGDSIIDDEEIPSCNSCELDNFGGETGVAVNEVLLPNQVKRRALPWGSTR